jgi:hypothetical protein
VAAARSEDARARSRTAAASSDIEGARLGEGKAYLWRKRGCGFAIGVRISVEEIG